jgi:hypothetical protein
MSLLSKIEILASRLQGSDEARTWILQHADYANDWCCLIWPFGRIQSGYAAVGRDALAVHRVMCEYRNGPPPTPKHQAAHSCGRGKDGCVNPMHLSWKTNSENQLERYQHSGPTKRAKLTPSQVDEIMALKGRARIADIAKQFGVSDSNIRGIHAGHLWKDTSTRLVRVFTEDEVRLIRSVPASVKNARQFASELNCNMNAIHRIRGGKSYKWVPESDDPTTEHPATEGQGK